MAVIQAPIVIEAPSVEPITLQEAKNHLNELLADYDDTISALIKAARVAAENYTGRALITQTLGLAIDVFSKQIEIPKPPLQQVNSITYIDESGQPQILSPSVYVVDTKSTPGRVVFNSGQSWPATLSIPSAIVIEYVSGYGDNPGDVPESIRQGMKLYLSKYYDLDQRDGDYLDKAIVASFDQERLLSI